jgi:hypothetical protein
MYFPEYGDAKKIMPRASVASAIVVRQRIGSRTGGGAGSSIEGDMYGLCSMRRSKLAGLVIVRNIRPTQSRDHEQRRSDDGHDDRPNQCRLAKESAAVPVIRVGPNAGMNKQ